MNRVMSDVLGLVVCLLAAAVITVACIAAARRNGDLP